MHGDDRLTCPSPAEYAGRAAEVARDEPMPAPAEPEPMPAAAAWAVERIGRPPQQPERAARVDSRQEQPETQDAPYEAGH